MMVVVTASAHVTPHMIADDLGERMLTLVRLWSFLSASLQCLSLAEGRHPLEEAAAGSLHAARLRAVAHGTGIAAAATVAARQATVGVHPVVVARVVIEDQARAGVAAAATGVDVVVLHTALLAIRYQEGLFIKHSTEDIYG